MSNNVVDIPDNYPSKGRAERGAWFQDSEGNMLGIGGRPSNETRRGARARRLLPPPSGCRRLAAAETGASNDMTYSVAITPIDGATTDRMGTWDARVAQLSEGDPAVVEAFNHASRIAAQEQIDRAKFESNPGEQWNFEGALAGGLQEYRYRPADPRHPLLRRPPHLVHQHRGDRQQKRRPDHAHRPLRRCSRPG